MRIRRSPIIFHNVISTKATCSNQEWPQVARDLRNVVLKNGLYGTGPVMYEVELAEDQENLDYTFYIPINEKIELNTNDKYYFTEKLEFEDGLVVRHADMEEPLESSYDIIKMTAEAMKLKLRDNFLNIHLDVYGGSIIDIYAPIIGDETDD